MKLILAAITIPLTACAAQPSANKYEFDRFSPELPQLLEMDAGTVLVRGISIDMRSQVCSRVSPQAAVQVAQEILQWKKRNEGFTKAAGSVINDLFARIESARGTGAKPSYLGQTMATTAKVSSARVASQFGGPSPDNALVPPFVLSWFSQP